MLSTQTLSSFSIYELKGYLLLDQNIYFLSFKDNKSLLILSQYGFYYLLKYQNYFNAY